MYKHILNNLIPADDLHWCEEEKKYVSLSRDDIDRIAATCLNQGISSLDDIMKVVEWAGVVRIGEILWRNFLSGGIRVVGFDEQGEPKFGPRQEKVNDN
jgi:hypothetical protein